MAGDLAERLRQAAPVGGWRGILSIARGGLIPSALISYALGLRRVRVMTIASYDDRSRGQLRIKDGTALPGDGDGWLVVEDIADTGSTLKLVRALAPRTKIAVLVAKTDGLSSTDFAIRTVPQSCWVDFPWERREA